MTFTELQTEIADRLNLSSSSDLTRIGRAINRVYRQVTTAIGLQLSRRAPISATASIGISTITLSNTEKVINVYNRAVSPYRELKEETLDELESRMPFVASDSPTKYAIKSQTSDTITILINVIPQTAFALYLDVHQVVADLSGSNEPAFPESYHDVLFHGVLIDEYDKLEKPALSTKAEKKYDQRLSDLRMWIATGAADVWQGKTKDDRVFNTSGVGGGGGSINGSLSYTQTGLITFDRSAAAPSDAPFAVVSGANMVANLDSNFVGGETAAQLHVAGSLTGTYAALSGAAITTLNASNISSGTLADARLNATICRLGSANTGGHLIFTDNTYDIGASGATRPRNIYIGTSLVAGDGVTATNHILSVSGVVGTTTKGFLAFDSDGVVRLSNAGGTGFTRLIFGGTSSAFPALRRTGTSIDAVLADNSAYAPIFAANFHAGITGYAEYGRAFQLGHWQTIAYSAGNFTASAGTWTVDSGDVIFNQYTIVGKMLFWQLTIGTSSVSTTPANLIIAAPGGVTLASSPFCKMAYANDNGTVVDANGQAITGSTFAIFKTNGAAWAASTNNTYIYFNIVTPIT